MGVINRPETSFDGASHTYGLEGWDDKDVIGVSSAAKVGGVEETWGIASAWGFRIGYEGAIEALRDEWEGFNVPWGQITPDVLRAELQKRGLTPWSKRDKAADRGNWVHDVLEALAQDNRIPRLDEFPEEVRGHVKSILGWYVDYRPSFVATEVQVASRAYGFAGRYDMRATITARKLLGLFKGHDSGQSRNLEALTAFGAHSDALCLIDLKTSKGVYPTTHFPQLAGYELASVEMGFKPTDAQLVLNSHEDGSPATLAASWSTGEDFVAYLGALRAVRRIKAADPEEKLRKMREEDILLELRDGPQWSRAIPELVPSCDTLDGKQVGRIMGGMKKRGLVEQDERKRWHLRA